MATIVDVARKAQVSPMTVSRVINGTGTVKEETRKRVIEAMEELHYYPDYNARGLVKKKTNLLYLLMTDITNPFFTTLARGAEDQANRHGYRLLFGNSDESLDKEKEYVEMLLSTKVDGVLFAPSGDDSLKHLQTLRKHNIPFVILDRYVPGIESDQVLGDNLLGARLLMEHLIQQGHRSIACLCGPQHISTARDRLKGYRESLLLNGIPYDSALVMETDYKLESGRFAMETLLSRESYPSAILAANNLVAIGVIQALQRRGFSIPEQMRVVTFDDLGPLSILHPFLTIVSQPAYDFGSMGVQLLLDRIHGTGPKEWRTIVLPPQFIDHQSSEKRGY
ncbi:LacI family DNA-binding transcriptional regulator [Ammoniphilus sp. YIM 78166]|uniref:LacI family DNA-binding transcriptional regulator n=1 Tax=Ammoniphilus sp. YIM 78166 TaxID=1644106 RepID=UPI00106FDE15|nr:LacI family DNA-binding transcriptional regulator [Ammoniphilus sp. YIM 78166]